jgi:hypothetical protein
VARACDRFAPTEVDSPERKHTMSTSVIPPTSTGDFTPEQWRELTEPLRRREEALAQLAAARSLVLRASSRWPELGLRRRSMLSIDEARLSLEPASVQQVVPAWALRVVRYPRWPMLMRRGGAVTEVAVLTHDEVRQGPRLMDEMSKAVAALESR